MGCMKRLWRQMPLGHREPPSEKPSSMVPSRRTGAGVTCQWGRDSPSANHCPGEARQAAHQQGTQHDGDQGRLREPPGVWSENAAGQWACPARAHPDLGLEPPHATARARGTDARVRGVWGGLWRREEMVAHPQASGLLVGTAALLQDRGHLLVPTQNSTREPHAEALGTPRGLDGAESGPHRP